MKLVDGKTFDMIEYKAALEYLKSCKNTTIQINANQLEIIVENQQAILLCKYKNKIDSYLVRNTFLYKLLKWFNLSYHNIEHFNKDTLVSICNDNLKAIGKKHQEILVKIENNEALSIVSEYFTPVSDIEVIDIAKKYLGNFKISRDDFGMRIYSEIKSEAEPIVGDFCGFGFNVTNSQTGFLALKAEHFILRYVCSNGATSKIYNENIPYNHYKKNKKVIFENLHNTLANMPLQPNRYIQGVKKAVNINANTLFPDINYKVNNIIGNKNGYKLFKDFDKTTKTKYDLFNHITHLAKQFKVVERYRLEQLAGNMIY